MIDHERARELARLSQETLLDPADQAWLDEHLASCEACRETIAPSDAASDGIASPSHRGHPDTRAIRGLARRPAVIGTVAALAIALVAGGLAWNAGRSGDDRMDDGHASPSAVAGTTATPSPDRWASSEPLPGTAATPIATLAALESTADVVALDARFRLASTDATPASELAARLSVRPSIAFRAEPESDGRAVVLTPAEPLRPGVVYRFALDGTDGELLDTWAFQARQPLRVVATLPADQETDVPRDTGIEVTFDQDGVVDAASHLTIKPATRGRFEQHERTLAFIPAKPLTAATVYEVTVSPGVAVGDTGEATDQATRFRFETAATSKQKRAVTFTFPDPLAESPTAERPVLALWWTSAANKPKLPKTARIDVYRLADLAAAVKAYQSLRTTPDWSGWSKAGLLDTTKLTRVARVDARLNKLDNAFWVRLPNRLPAGWYLVEHPGAIRPIQVVLQVTDIAGYLATSETRTLVWANDLKGGGPVVGATVASDGTEIGSTGANGLAMGATPPALKRDPSVPCVEGCDPVVTVRTPNGRAIFLPARSSSDVQGGFDDYWWSTSAPRYWSLLDTDRTRYRPTDTINVWGVLRDRDTGKVPATVTVRLTNQSYDDSDARPALASVTAKPGPAGAFTGSIALSGMTDGDYNIELLVGSEVIRTTYANVGRIAKPAYRLAVETGRRVYVKGDRIRVTVHANFFEGTPVAGVPLDVRTYSPARGEDVNHRVKTDATGAASYRTTAKVDPDEGGPREAEFYVSPARAEEGEISGASSGYIVFPSTQTVDAAASISKGRVRVSGGVHLVDRERLESELAHGRSFWELDPRGAAVRGETVTVRFRELIPVRRDLGTRYDFIEKKVVQTYSFDIDEGPVQTVRVKTASNGTYTASIPATTKDHDYAVTVSATDPSGGVSRAGSDATRHPWSSYERSNATLRQTDPTATDESATFSIGDRVDLTMHDPDTKQAAGDGTRYLFFLAQRGLREATVQSSRRFVTTYERWAAPNLTVGAVRFDGHGYVGGLRFDAGFKASDRRLRVDLATGAPRYAPGDMATRRCPHTRCIRRTDRRHRHPAGRRREAVHHRRRGGPGPPAGAVRVGLARRRGHVQVASGAAQPIRRRRHRRWWRRRPRRLP